MSEEHLRQRRADLLKAAVAVFMERGYERTTMKHVMEAAGVSRGGLYQYFANKEDLFEAVLEERLEDSAEETDRMLEEASSYWNLLLKVMFGGETVPDAEMDPLAASSLEFFITGRNDERRRIYGEKRYDLGLSIYRKVIEAGQASGEFSDYYEGELVARSIVTFFDGLALDHAILPEEKVRVKDQSEMLVDYLKLALGVSSS
ncbi:TetR family transcriptional regulator [Halobacillus litoralis]|uniref:TetR family transcriptional regulator n=1 Tax=Halobacillus litoralis TaxID=45668 RepID=UPI001CFDEA80|nr:TetR/AcrR family transcriptional regulator [Halobacillus litoralis]